MDQKSQVVLNTERLCLRTPSAFYAEIFLDFMTRNKEFFRPWTPAWSEDYFTVEKQRQLLKKNYNGFESEKEIRFFIFLKSNSDRIIDDIGFRNIVKGPFLSCHMGYKMDQKETRKGYMQEALREALRYVFDTVQLHRIEANIIPGNKPSIRLIEKLGFHNEGLSKKYLRINGKWEDHFHFVLLNDAVEQRVKYSGNFPIHCKVGDHEI